MEKTELRFEQCPICKLREELAEILGKPELKLGDGKTRFFKELCQHLKDLGFASEGFEFYLNSVRGVVLDQSKEKSIPVGSEVPGFEVYTDICSDCGTIYAVKLLSGGAQKTVAPTKLALPGDSLIPPFSIPPGAEQGRRN